MGTKYWLPCSCGQKLQIETTQAGQTLTCSGCQQSIDVPNMREVRALEEVSEEDPRVVRRSWHPVQGYVFAGGLLLTVLCGGGGVYLVLAANGWRDYADQKDPLELQLAEIDRATIDQSLRLFRADQAQGLAGARVQEHANARRVATQLERVAIVAGVLTVIGLAMVSGALLFRRKT